MNDFATKILQFRAENNLNQEQFAELVNSTRVTVSIWERGKGAPSKVNKIRIERILKNYKKE